ncbi:oxygenase MpaB family protein [Mycolicibacterium brumae]|uniref:DUF2236 domain-containing protein n=1 Tax=Mycolicibacterium brumae TaxID=85968 RepID=A0A2G5P9A4_9MYCO|nr:oxygenase MpaB family protein [Mycolicibacterium brumae]MCV7193993.1 DUF2236 domain-containing protein [Mycolicibacterium brumae]PIB74941.1 DUF2236 domain-containing protein [Mycolicibacterium brumae]RWA22429.1 hypothetical protein MBRU_12670 [Mycolicibacterium brumae DSM 44177]UWW08043.1 DUF2236 domain-containing protein [Mycolicibacterium brumae]
MESSQGKLPNPQALREFPFKYFVPLLASGDVRATAAQRSDFRKFADMGDPLADDVVAMIARMPPRVGRAMFETAVDRGLDAVEDPPEELVAFFNQVENQPYWLDYDKLALAARVSMRTGLVGIGLALPGLALTGGYLASRADKPLVGTGDLYAMAPRRLNETATWYIDVTSPGGLDRFADGFTGALRVRLMHAQVRAAMNRRPDWDHQNWDTPINQAQLAGTLLLFSLANLVGCQAMGMRFNDRERDAVFHFWRYVGLLMGVHPELVPTSEADTWKLMWLEAETEFVPDEDSLKLAQALHNRRDDDALTQMARSYLSAYSRLMLGRTNADRLGLADNKALQAAVLATAAANRVLDYHRLVPGMTWLAEEMGQRARRGFVTKGLAMTGGDRSYRRHDRLAAVS